MTLRDHRASGDEADGDEAERDPANAEPLQSGSLAESRSTWRDARVRIPLPGYPARDQLASESHAGGSGQRSPVRVTTQQSRLLL
jgi:hypothetical protein